jgi:hypothetical protein
VSDPSDAELWAALNVDTLRFDDDVSGYDLSTLPAPGSVVVPLIVDVDADLAANLQQAARVQGVSVGEIVRRRLRGAA